MQRNKTSQNAGQWSSVLIWEGTLCNQGFICCLHIGLWCLVERMFTFWFYPQHPASGPVLICRVCTQDWALCQVICLRGSSDYNTGNVKTVLDDFKLHGCINVYVWFSPFTDGLRWRDLFTGKLPVKEHKSTFFDQMVLIYVGDTKAGSKLLIYLFILMHSVAEVIIVIQSTKCEHFKFPKCESIVKFSPQAQCEL